MKWSNAAAAFSPPIPIAHPQNYFEKVEYKGRLVPFMRVNITILDTALK